MRHQLAERLPAEELTSGQTVVRIDYRNVGGVRLPLYRSAKIQRVVPSATIEGGISITWSDGTRSGHPPTQMFRLVTEGGVDDRLDRPAGR